MAINWNKLEIDIKNYLEEGRKNTEGKLRNFKSVAKQIELFYINEIKTNATDIFLNPVVLLNIGENIGLHKSLEDAFNVSFKNNNNSILNNAGTSGVLQHWASAQFSPLIPVLPVMVKGINNVIVFSGNVIPMQLKGNSDKEDFLAKEIVKSLKQHASTIQGLFTGLNSQGSIITIPWSGIV